MLHRGGRPLAVAAPDLVQDRLQPDAMLVDGPQLDGGLREGACARSDERAEVFLKSACCSASACTWRGRGLRRLPSKRTRWAQPRETLIGQPSRLLIQAAPAPPSPSSPPRPRPPP